MTAYLFDLISLVAIVNPLGAVPIFLSATDGQTRRERIRTARIASTTVFVTLAIAALLGSHILRLFGISTASFQVGGGILILLMAISMLQGRVGLVKHGPDEASEAEDRDAVGVVPIGIPLMSGPGSIALTIVIAARESGPAHLAVLCVLVGLLAGICWTALRLGIRLGDRLGKTEINVGTRIMGLLLAALAVELIAGGTRVLLPGLAGTEGIGVK